MDWARRFALVPCFQLELGHRFFVLFRGFGVFGSANIWMQLVDGFGKGIHKSVTIMKQSNGTHELLEIVANFLGFFEMCPLAPDAGGIDRRGSIIIGASTSGGM